MISQSKGKCMLTYGRKNENTQHSMKTSSSLKQLLKFPPLSQVMTSKFKILQILALAHSPQCATTDATAFCKPLKLAS